MDEPSPKTGFSAELRGVLSGREPPPAAFIERRPSYPWFVVGTVSIGAFMGHTRCKHSTAPPARSRARVRRIRNRLKIRVTNGRRAESVVIL